MMVFNARDFVYGPSPYGYEFRAVYQVIEQTNPHRVLCRHSNGQEYLYPVADLEFIHEG